MEHTEPTHVPEHLHRELFGAHEPAGARSGVRTALLGALIVALTAGGALWATGASLPWIV